MLGSRIIVQLLENATDDARRLMLAQLLPHVRSLAADMAGNFIIQKLLEICALCLLLLLLLLRSLCC